MGSPASALYTDMQSAHFGLLGSARQWTLWASASTVKGSGLIGLGFSGSCGPHETTCESTVALMKRSVWRSRPCARWKLPTWNGSTRHSTNRSFTEGASDRVAISIDRKSTRLNSSHTVISYAVFCFKKKKNIRNKEFDRQR